MVGAIAYRSAAGRPVSRDRAADHLRARVLSGRERRRCRRHRGHADRAGDQRRREHALHVRAMQQRRPDAAGGDVQGRHGLDKAQVLVQNRVAIAVPRLPEEVRALGVTTRKRRPTCAMVVHLISPSALRPGLPRQLCAHLQVRDVLARVAGRGRLDHLRRAGLLHAHLARPGEALRAQPDGERHRGGHPRAERGGGGGHVRPAAGAARQPRSSCR